MCTEGLLNTKPRVPTEYGFVRDRGVAKSFSSDCMHAEAAHTPCQGRVQSLEFADSAHALCQRTRAKSCIC